MNPTERAHNAGNVASITGLFLEWDAQAPKEFLPADMLSAGGERVGEQRDLSWTPNLGPLAKV